MAKKTDLDNVLNKSIRRSMLKVIAIGATPVMGYPKLILNWTKAAV